MKHLRTAFVALLVAACSSSSPTTPTGTGGGGANPQTFAEAACNFLQKCNPTNVKQLYGDVAGCVATQTPLVAANFHAAGNTLTQPQLEACTSKIGTDCNTFFDTVPECEFKGALKEAAPCVYNAQCESGSCFKTDESPNCGTCKAKVAVGTSCASNDCQLGLFCEAGTADNVYTCVEPVRTEGGACSDARPCIDRFNCVDGKCASLLKEGEKCDDTTGKHCDYDLTCLADGAGTGNVCQAFKFAAAGGKCGFDTAAKTLTECQGSTCSNVTENGTCVAFLQKGAACTFEGASCAPGLTCEAGACADLNDVGTCH